MANIIVNATEEDTEEILRLYGTMRGGAAGWTDSYPARDSIRFDLDHNDLYVMKNDMGEIVATITIDHDDQVEALECWDPALAPASELSRLCVRKDLQNQGIARQMMEHTFAVLRARGMKGVHLIVRKEHKIALASYAHLNYKVAGECDLYDNKHFVCLERAL